MRDELRLFEQTVPDVGTVLFPSLSALRAAPLSDEEICLMKY